MDHIEVRNAGSEGGDEGHEDDDHSWVYCVNLAEGRAAANEALHVLGQHAVKVPTQRHAVQRRRHMREISQLIIERL